MSLLRFSLAAAAFALSGCSSAPDWYAPPVQRQPLAVSEPSFVGAYVDMSNPNADAYIVKDVSPAVEAGSWRWTSRRPELQFYLPAGKAFKFVMEFALAGTTFKETGPVTLTVRINEKVLDRFRFDTEGNHRLEKPVPPELLLPDALNRVSIEPDKVWVSKEDGAALGFILTSAGFQE